MNTRIFILLSALLLSVFRFISSEDVLAKVFLHQKRSNMSIAPHSLLGPRTQVKDYKEITCEDFIERYLWVHREVFPKDFKFVSNNKNQTAQLIHAGANIDHSGQKQGHPDLNYLRVVPPMKRTSEKDANVAIHASTNAFGFWTFQIDYDWIQDPQNKGKIDKDKIKTRSLKYVFSPRKQDEKVFCDLMEIQDSEVPQPITLDACRTAEKNSIPYERCTDLGGISRSFLQLRVEKLEADRQKLESSASSDGKAPPRRAEGAKSGSM